MNKIEQWVHRLPWGLQRMFWRARERWSDRTGSRLTAQEVFSAVYAERRWGEGDQARFYSGWGSHDASVVEAYVEAVNSFLGEFANKPDVVDLGCGDFNIGRQIRAGCGRYVACDVVPELIKHNKQTFSDLAVDFLCLDIVADELPGGDVAFIRQVLQHLSNAQIQSVLIKLKAFKYIVLTEHLPSENAFTPNLDKGAGDDVRPHRVVPSAVVLTEEPFSFTPASSRVLCEVATKGGRLQTIVYKN